MSICCKLGASMKYLLYLIACLPAFTVCNRILKHVHVPSAIQLQVMSISFVSNDGSCAWVQSFNGLHIKIPQGLNLPAGCVTYQRVSWTSFFRPPVTYTNSGRCDLFKFQSVLLRRQRTAPRRSNMSFYFITITASHAPRECKTARP